MSERKWTDEQLLAINTRDKTLLVSAAAGSGKTATLTERIIRSVLDEQSPISIKDMLIVTFTNAAVGELRERIGAAIKAAAKLHPDNARLEEELLTVRDAKIMTIDAFCNSILRSCAASVGLPPNYRIGDTAELALLSSSVMEGLIEAAYEGELPEICTPREFSLLAECLTTARGSGRLNECFLELYEKTESAENGVEALLPLVEEFNPAQFTDPGATVYGKYIADEVKACAKSCLKVFSCLDSMAGRGGRDGAVYDRFLVERGALSAIAEAADFSTLQRLVLDFPFASLRGIRGDKSEEYLKIEWAREIMKTDFARFKSKYFTYSAAEWKELYSELYSKLSLVYRFLRKFDTVFTNEKKSKGICSYSDIERYACAALIKNGERTDLAKEISASFKAVYIDEYQDVNSLQNRIFEAVSQKDNRFMVGDIKQSIYGFRSAKPEIFAKMKAEYPKLSEDADSPCACLFMSSNFRCDANIVDFVNGIFDSMFSLLGDSIGYEEGDRLKFAKVYPEGSSPCSNIPQIHVFEKLGADTGYDLSDDAALTDQISDEEEKEISAAAAGVARKVRELLEHGRKADGEPYRPSDVAIIMRSAKGRAESYRQALAAQGIRASVADNGEFLMNEEILLTLSLLNTIDNPRKEIYLTGLLLSPIYSFTPDELVAIRLASRSETLYEALVEYCDANPDFIKGHTFLSELAEYRSLSEGISIDKLLSILFRRTGLLALAEKNGGKDNLILLHNLARSYEQSSYKGLYSFISYINSIIEEGKTFETGMTSDEDGDTVKILTAHKSKGLEFPACFFVESGTGIRKSSSDRIAYAEDFGISMLVKDPSGTALVENPVQNVINRYKSDKEYEEELRILYVILTRAREALYVYATSGTKYLDKKLDTIKLSGELADSYTAKKYSSMFEIIVANRKSGELIVETAENGCDAPCIEQISDNDAEAVSQIDGSAEDDARELVSRFLYEYPYKHLQTLPEKLSVSKLYPDVLDGADKDALTLDELDLAHRDSGEDDFKPYLPSFISGKSADESAKRGIATHTFLQFCDFGKLMESGAKAELDRLVKKAYISEEDGARVRIKEIDAFTKSRLFSEMTEAKSLHRELRFNVKLPASEFTQSEELKSALEGEEILVQGVIDCIIEAPDGSLHLVDYKTDRLTTQELNNPELAQSRLRAAHSLQLSYYAKAVEILFGRLPEKIGIYSLHMGTEIPLYAERSTN